MWPSAFLHHRKVFRTKKQSALFKANPWHECHSYYHFQLWSPNLAFPSFHSPIKLSFVLILSQTRKSLIPTLYSLMDACFFDCYLFILTTSQIHFSSFSSDIMLFFFFITFLFLLTLSFQPMEIILYIYFSWRENSAYLCLVRGKGGERGIVLLKYLVSNT